MNRVWRIVNEERFCKEIVQCSKTYELRHLGAKYRKTLDESWKLKR